MQPSTTTRPEPPAPSRAAVAFIQWTLRHGRALWVVALALAVPAALRTVTLYAHLRSDVEELLPRQAASVLAIDELRERMPGLQFLGVVVDTGTPANIAAGDRFIDDLAAKIRTYPPSMVRAVRTGTQKERRFLEDHAPLYVDLPDLQNIKARIEARRDYDVGHALGTSLDDAPPPPLDFSDLQAKYRSRTGEQKGHLTNGRFSNAALHTSLLVIEAGHFSTGDSQKALLERVRADITAMGGVTRYAPGMRYGFSGDVAITVEEVSALVSDISVSSVLCIVAVIAVIVVYYRWWQSVLVLLAPLLLATVYAFALASLPPFRVNELNSNTAFLGSIIVGNGINFGIILLARYLEERRSGAEVEKALVSAAWSARPGTMSAALAASASYAALVLTEFRGFHQFGVIGGIGMVASWLVAYVLMPPLIAWVEARSKAPPRPKPPGIVARAAPLLRRIALPVTVVTVVLTAAAAWEASRFDASHLEYDLSKLRRRDTWTVGEGYWGRKMDALLGQYLSPMVILADTEPQARVIGAAARARMKSDPAFARMVSTIRTADDVLPSDQPAKIAVVEQIRRMLTPKIRSLLGDDARAELDRLLGKPDLHPITLADLPTTFTEAMLERDGSFGKTVLIYPTPQKAFWSGDPLIAFVAKLREIAHTPVAGTAPARVAGSLPLSADIISSIIRDGPRSSLLAFLGVVAVVVVIFRAHKTTVYVLAALVTGVLYLFAGAMVFGVKINFSNFIAFPITFGIGVDYAVNIVSRVAQEPGEDAEGAVRSIGGAVALCSLTTIIGYSSLLLAENRALYLFGLLAVMGEVACLSTALVALPSALIVLRRCRFGAARSSTG